MKMSYARTGQGGQWVFPPGAVSFSHLEQNNKGSEITDWLVYFAKTILEAQAYIQKLIDFLIKKSEFYEKLRGKMNARQEKVIARLFHEGPWRQ